MENSFKITEVLGISTFYLLQSDSDSLIGLRDFIDTHAERSGRDDIKFCVIEGGGHVPLALEMALLVHKHFDKIEIVSATSAGCIFWCLKDALVAPHANVETHAPWSNEMKELPVSWNTYHRIRQFMLNAMQTNKRIFDPARVYDYLKAMELAYNYGVAHDCDPFHTWVPLPIPRDFQLPVAPNLPKTKDYVQ